MLGQSQLPIGIRVGGSKAVDRLALDMSDTPSKEYCARSARLYAVAALDDVCLERDWSRAAMQLQKQPAGVAQHGARLIATPERGGARGAVLADRLKMR